MSGNFNFVCIKMESNTNINYRFDPRCYEDHLSAFGKKVLNVLINKWKSDQNRAQNAPQQRFTPSIRNIKVLTDDLKPSPPTIITNKESHDRNSLDLNKTAENLIHMSTAAELVQTVDTPKGKIINDPVNISSYDLINPVINDNMNISSKMFFKDLTNLKRAGNYDKEDLNNCNSIDWDNMFDTELFTDAAITNAKLETKQIEMPASNTFGIQFPRENSKKTDESKTDSIKKSKRKQQSITDTIPKKVKKVSEKTNINRRKQKYTKAVKNWLNDVDLRYPDENEEVCARVVAENKNKAEIIIEKFKDKSNKKIIQTQLAKKDGIMKFQKPESESTSKHEYDKTRESVIILDKKVVSESDTPKKNKSQEELIRDKKNKPKFVAPLKSQIPVKDVKYNVVTVNSSDGSDGLDHVAILKSIKNKDIVFVLIYSNGFSQLNNHHTEDTCENESIMININDDFYYFKCHQYDRDILQLILENNKITCYEGKPLLIYLKSKFDLDIYNIDMIDTKIGGSILDPDSPPENFSELQKLLSFTPPFTIATECMLQKAAWYITLLKECASKLVRVLMEEQLWNVFEQIEMKLLPIIAEMERRGVTVDLQKLKSMEEVLITKMKATELECYKAAGKSFQINSAMQVRALIYDELQLDTKCNVKIRETLAKGAKSTSETMLRSLSSGHPLPRLILKYRHLHKAHATFLTGIAQHVKDGIVRPTWVQTAAATGRIASNNPNLQAIPKAPFSLILFPEDSDTDKQALSIRSVYTARARCTLLAADFRHVECRVFAHAAADGQLLRALHAGPDLFRTLASTWLQKAEGEVTREERERTKRIVYASLYGAGVRKLMDILQVSYEQALAITASFNRRFPSLKSFGRSVVSRCAQSGGRLATPCGRARRFQHIASPDFALKSQAERQAVNFIIQGSAADICKTAMVATAAALRRSAPPLGARLLLQLHDELLWEVHERDLEPAAVIIKREMEECGRRCGLAGVLPVALTAGPNWGEMVEYLPGGRRVDKHDVSDCH